MTSPDILQLMQAMIVKILPLYAVMALGFAFGRARPKAAEPMSFLQIYFIAPVVIASGIANMDFQAQYLLLPVITFAFCCGIGLAAYVAAKRIWRDNTANIFSYACGSGNTGYYGVPIALILFPPEILGVFMVAAVGFTLFEGSLGFYLVARGHFTAKDSLRKLARLPILYAFTLGVICSLLGAHVPDAAHEIMRDFRGCYVVIGALMIGLGLSQLKHLKIEPKLAAFVFSFKFLVWPILTFAFITADRAITHIFTPEIHKILMVLAVMPLPANTIAYALQLNVQPDKASTLVFLSTLFALIYVPLVMAFWG